MPRMVAPSSSIVEHDLGRRRRPRRVTRSGTCVGRRGRLVATAPSSAEEIAHQALGAGGRGAARGVRLPAVREEAAARERSGRPGLEGLVAGRAAVRGGAALRTARRRRRRRRARGRARRSGWRATGARADRAVRAAARRAAGRGRPRRGRGRRGRRSGRRRRRPPRRARSSAAGRRGQSIALTSGGDDAPRLRPARRRARGRARRGGAGRARARSGGRGRRSVGRTRARSRATSAQMTRPSQRRPLSSSRSTVGLVADGLVARHDEPVAERDPARARRGAGRARRASERRTRATTSAAARSFAAVRAHALILWSAVIISSMAVACAPSRCAWADDVAEALVGLRRQLGADQELASARRARGSGGARRPAGRARSRSR